MAAAASRLAPDIGSMTAGQERSRAFQEEAERFAHARVFTAPKFAQMPVIRLTRGPRREA